MNSSSKVARETHGAIHNEASNEIIEKLLDLVEKIVIIARMIDNEYYFKKRAVLSKDWLHANHRAVQWRPEDRDDDYLAGSTPADADVHSMGR